MWPFSRKRKADPPAVEPERKDPAFEASIENPSTPLTADELVLITGGSPTIAGPLVSETTSIRSVDVFRCVSIISGMCASLRMNVYRTDMSSGLRSLSPNHRLYPLLRMAPNPYMSAFNWKELILVNLCLWGNHYSRIEYDNAGRIKGFVPLPPPIVDPFREKDGTLKYKVTTEGGYEVYNSEDMIHVPGLGFDGLRGLPVISAVARQAIGTSLAMEEFTAKLHANGVRPSGIGKVKEGISPEALRRMKHTFETLYSGSTNAGTTLWVDSGTEWQPMQLSPQDAQTLDARRLSTAQICNAFGVPAVLLNENANMTAWGSGIEQIMLGFLMTSINPWLERIESELNRKLFMGSQFDVEFDREGLIVLDSKSKAELFQKLINSGVMTPNEARRKLNLPDMEGGDQLFIQGATVPLNQAGAQQQTPDAPPPPAPNQGSNG